MGSSVKTRDRFGECQGSRMCFRIDGDRRRRRRCLLGGSVIDAQVPEPDTAQTDSKDVESDEDLAPGGCIRPRPRADGIIHGLGEAPRQENRHHDEHESIEDGREIRTHNVEGKMTQRPASGRGVGDIAESNDKRLQEKRAGTPGSSPVGKIRIRGDPPPCGTCHGTGIMADGDTTVGDEDGETQPGKDTRGSEDL